MSNTTIRLNDLSFDGIKASLKEFLSNQNTLQDYNFEGSNLAVILDLLAYNTQQNAVSLNMIFNEMFMDTVQTFDVAASHAKELGYTPRSARASVATINLKINPHDEPASIIIPAGTKFSTAHLGQSYTFSTLEPVIASIAQDYQANDVAIVEGFAITDVYTYQNSEDQQFIISNKDVDTTTISVSVTTNGVTTSYDKATSVLDYDDQSLIFFVSSSYDEKYQIEFGDGLVGRKPDTGSTVSISYHVASKEASNGATSFIAAGSIAGYSNVEVTLVEAAIGGAERETLTSVKYYAPRFYQARERAVTAADYQVLMKANFPEIRAINVYGGETLSPPQFGKAVMSIDVADADGVSEGRKEAYRKFILERCPSTVVPTFIDPDFIYLNINVAAQVDKARTSQSLSRISAAIEQVVIDFVEENLSDFNTTFFFSKLQKEIDASSTAIQGNTTDVDLVYEITLSTTGTQSIQVSFGNAITPNSLVTSIFNVGGARTYLSDDGEGLIFPTTYSGNVATKGNVSVGTIDYTTGVVDLSFTADSQASVLELIVTPASQIVSATNNILFAIKNVSVSTS